MARAPYVLPCLERTSGLLKQVSPSPHLSGGMGHGWPLCPATPHTALPIRHDSPAWRHKDPAPLGLLEWSWKVSRRFHAMEHRDMARGQLHVSCWRATDRMMEISGSSSVAVWQRTCTAVGRPDEVAAVLCEQADGDPRSVTPRRRPLVPLYDLLSAGNTQDI